MMLHANIFKINSPEKMKTDNISLSPGDKNPLNMPHFVQKPSNFSIEHILNSAGSTRDKFISDFNQHQVTDQMRHLSNSRNDQYLIDNDAHQYPPILDWLNYTRYKPPRLPRKLLKLCIILLNIDRFRLILNTSLGFIWHEIYLKK